MHFQPAPDTEARLIRCTMGSIHDVIIDLRPDSLTFLQHWSVVLSAANRRAIYVPEGFAHGFQSVAAGAEVSTRCRYPMPGASVGVRWNDPAFSLLAPAGNGHV